ncbi:MAG: hypothetical protein EON58_01875 [Alphaproteobacteria bacterium]|nr:MAG: hypothetical protein EON58_01875 [Alphaproteobacteria bacterium]
MARYYLHLRDHIEETLDPEGVELPDLNAVKQAVLENVRDVLAGELRSTGVLDLRYRVDAETGDGEVVHSLTFKDAFSVIPDTA